MHPYATDFHGRRRIYLYLALIAITLTWGFSEMLALTGLTVPWWIGSPSTMAIYGGMYWLFDRHVWRWDVWRTIGILKIPDLQGLWRGYTVSSYDDHGAKHEVEVKIDQRWTSMSIVLEGEQSRSKSLSGALYTEAPEMNLIYQFQNDPGPSAPATMQIHYGTARLELEDSSVLQGDYYSGRGRQNIGRLVLERAT